LKLIDANVFIYAAGSEHRYKAPCLRVLRLVEAGDIDANTDIEVFQEVLHFYHARNRTAQGLAVVSHMATQFPFPLPVELPMILTAGRTLKSVPDMEARDAVHAAVVIHSGLDGIISADTDFNDIPGVARFDPLEF
jgi:predicted nucleic acid-binding protein